MEKLTDFEAILVVFKDCGVEHIEYEWEGLKTSEIILLRNGPYIRFNFLDGNFINTNIGNWRENLGPIPSY